MATIIRYDDDTFALFLLLQTNHRSLQIFYHGGAKCITAVINNCTFMMYYFVRQVGVKNCTVSYYQLMLMIHLRKVRCSMRIAVELIQFLIERIVD